jgi:hypothetical protein
MAIETVNSSSSLAEVIDRILDKGVVIDVWVRVSLVGIELLVVEARIVLASVETYLKYAEAIGLTSQAAVPARAIPGLSGLGIPAVPGVPAVPSVQDYVSRTPIPESGSYATDVLTRQPSTGSYVTGVSPSQPSTANPTDVVGGI